MAATSTVILPESQAMGIGDRSIAEIPNHSYLVGRGGKTG